MNNQTMTSIQTNIANHYSLRSSHSGTVIIGGIDFHRINIGKRRIVKFTLANTNSRPFKITNLFLQQSMKPLSPNRSNIINNSNDNYTFIQQQQQQQHQQVEVFQILSQFKFPIIIPPMNDFESSISFTPIYPGRFTALLSITSEDYPIPRIQQITLYGEGDIPSSPSQIIYTDNQVPIVIDTPKKIEFNQIEFNKTFNNINNNNHHNQIFKTPGGNLLSNINNSDGDNNDNSPNNNNNNNNNNNIYWQQQSSMPLFYDCDIDSINDITNKFFNTQYDQPQQQQQQQNQLNNNNNNVNTTPINNSNGSSKKEKKTVKFSPFPAQHQQPIIDNDEISYQNNSNNINNTNNISDNYLNNNHHYNHNNQQQNQFINYNEEEEDDEEEDDNKEEDDIIHSSSTIDEKFKQLEIKIKELSNKINSSSNNSKAIPFNINDQYNNYSNKNKLNIQNNKRLNHNHHENHNSSNNYYHNHHNYKHIQHQNNYQNHNQQPVQIETINNNNSNNNNNNNNNNNINTYQPPQPPQPQNQYKPRPQINYNPPPPQQQQNHYQHQPHYQPHYQQPQIPLNPIQQHQQPNQDDSVDIVLSNSAIDLLKDMQKTPLPKGQTPAAIRNFLKPDTDEAFSPLLDRFQNPNTPFFSRTKQL